VQVPTSYTTWTPLPHRGLVFSNAQFTRDRTTDHIQLLSVKMKIGNCILSQICWMMDRAQFPGSLNRSHFYSHFDQEFSFGPILGPSFGRKSKTSSSLGRP
jgi:hypothetical protein